MRETPRYKELAISAASPDLFSIKLLSMKLTFFTNFITFTYEWIPLFKIAYIYNMVYYSLQE